MKRIFWTFLLLLGLSLSLSIAAPQGKGKAVDKDKSDIPKKEAKDTAKEGKKTTGHSFGKKEKKAIRDYFSNQNNLEGLPPGLAKREELPPGLQRHLEKNGTLPPGLQKRLQPLPVDLETSLPKLPDGLKRGVIGDALVLVEEHSAKVVDVIAGIFSGK